MTLGAVLVHGGVQVGEDGQLAEGAPPTRGGARLSGRPRARQEGA